MAPPSTIRSSSSGDLLAYTTPSPVEFLWATVVLHLFFLSTPYIPLTYSYRALSSLNLASLPPLAFRALRTRPSLTIFHSTGSPCASAPTDPNHILRVNIRRAVQSRAIRLPSTITAKRDTRCLTHPGRTSTTTPPANPQRPASDFYLAQA